MQALVAADKEPIKPFITRVRSLWTQMRCSTILVVGGSGDYFDVADTVLLLDEYKCSDVTKRAKDLASSIPGGAPPESKEDRGMPRVPVRVIGSSGLSHGMKTAGTRSSIRFGELPELDLSGVEQIVEHSQVRAIAEACIQLCTAANSRSGPMATCDLPLPDALANIQAQIDQGGLDVLSPGSALATLRRQGCWRWVRPSRGFAPCRRRRGSRRSCRRYEVSDEGVCGVGVCDVFEAKIDHNLSTSTSFASSSSPFCASRRSSTSAAASCAPSVTISRLLQRASTTTAPLQRR